MSISLKFDFFRSLGSMAWTLAGCGNEGWTAGKWRDNSDVKVHGFAVLIKDKIHGFRFQRVQRHECCTRVTSRVSWTAAPREHVVALRSGTIQCAFGNLD